MIKKQKDIPYIHYKLLKQTNFLKTKKEFNLIKTRSRASTILPCMTQMTFATYNGQKTVPLLITEPIIGYKLGEFSMTKKFFSHTKLEKKLQHIKS